MTQEITSAANPLIKRFRLLADRRHRRREGAFVVQGVQPVWQAVEAGADIEVLIVAPDLLTLPAARQMVAAQEQRGRRVVRVPAALFARLAGRDGPGGLTVAPGSVFMALHEVGNPGNLGAIVRTASAAGAGGVILVGACADPHDPAAVKASMGAIFSVPVAAAADAAEFFDWAAAAAVRVAVTSARGAATLWESPLPLPAVLLLGSEGAGLPADLLARGDLQLRIPMTGTAESLNLAVAAGILLYETVRRSASAS